VLLLCRTKTVREADAEVKPVDHHQRCQSLLSRWTCQQGQGRQGVGSMSNTPALLPLVRRRRVLLTRIIFQFFQSVVKLM